MMMKWLVKAAVANALSVLPGGATVYYLLQRRVTRSLPPTLAQFHSRVQCARRHLCAFLQATGRGSVNDAVFLELGAGWELTMPLVFRSVGISRQMEIDVKRLVHMDLVRLTLERVRRLGPADLAGPPPALVPDAERLPRGLPASESELSDWLGQAGIEYRAPSDARATGFRDGSVDCVTSTATLEHIPPQDVRAILGEMYRLLRPAGILSCIIDMSDHYSSFDSRITPWHFLRYSERTWRLLNNGIIYQNRLRASTYVDLAASAGFEVRETTLAFPASCDMSALPQPPIHPTFTAWRDRQDLLATELHLVCRKPRGRS